METKRKGDFCEQLVADRLAEEGHLILARNYRCRYGEIDVLSLSGDGVLCVTEVKSLTGKWLAEDIMYMVGPQKRMRLRKTLGHFIASSGNKVQYKSIRLDVAAVTGGNVTFYRGDDF